MTAPACCRLERVSRPSRRALSAVVGAADRPDTPPPRTGPAGCSWPTSGSSGERERRNRVTNRSR